MTRLNGRILILDLILLVCAILCLVQAADRSFIPQDYDIVLPTVFHDDNTDIPPSQFITYSRKRRSLSSDNLPVFVNISTQTDTYHIKLTPNKQLLSPGFRIYHRHHGNLSDDITDDVTNDIISTTTNHNTGHSIDYVTDDITTTTTTNHNTGHNIDDITGCHYHGHVKSHNDTPVAMSLCHGISGVIMFPEDDYMIEPAPDHLKSKHRHHHHHQHHHHDNKEPHILYKRSSLESFQESADFNKYARSRAQFHRTRRKRSFISSERTVETLVVLDKDMYKSHGRENVTTYVLSIFNIVSQLYQDSSLGYPINIVLVGLVYLDGREPGLYITHHADKTLNSFCQWQAGIQSGNKKLHDHAVLLTGKDICSYRNAPCDTLGFAPIEGMCSELRSCIVNEDTGLSTAFTVAHEMGHNFGMLHDGDSNTCKETTGNIMSPTLSAQSGTFHWSTCSRQYMRKFLNFQIGTVSETTGNIMSPTLSAQSGTFHWSTCSRQYMRKFLNTAQSECLTSTSRNTAELKFPDQLPGEIFNADIQCVWQFGSHSKQCTFIFGRDPCQNLWCYKQSGMCETKFLPAAEGTACGDGMWCRHGRCVSYGKKGPTPINGWWTDWSNWSQCSRTCGGGVKTRHRECNNPRPQYGGKTCEGSDIMHKMCNLADCESSDSKFREEQCQAYDVRKSRSWYFKWRSHNRQPLSEVDDQCKLYCKASGYNYYYSMEKQVIDGTRCNQYSEDVCVNGNCEQVGCDLIIGSSARKDQCGVCRGDNSTCKIVQNTYTTQPRKNAYVKVTYLPRGASSINIEEIGIAPNNYLALKTKSGKYHLNGRWHLDREGIYKIAGAKFIYRRSYNRPESLMSDGPIKEELVLEALIGGRNPGIKYSFTVPKYRNNIPVPRDNFTWSVSLTDCSEPCAGGKQVVTAHCHRNHGEEVDTAYCDRDDKPGTGIFPCNVDPCGPRWVEGPWNVCSKPCGGGKQRRKIHCLQKLSLTEDRKVPRKYCSTEDKPTRKRECNTHECPPVWYTGRWSKCSASCDKGVKTRTVACRSKTLVGQVVLPDTMCSRQPKPTLQKGCRVRKCPDPTARWIVSAWSKCQGSCGSGIKTRVVRCTKKSRKGKEKAVRDKHCKHLPHREIRVREKCQLKECPDENIPRWYSSPWSKCSVSCGAGNQTRLVHCIHPHEKRLARDCDYTVKPVAFQTCQEKPCPTPDPLCQDHFAWCQLVPKHNICNHTFYGTKCCRSCWSR